jgi:hypothetical protein
MLLGELFKAADIALYLLPCALSLRDNVIRPAGPMLTVFLGVGLLNFLALEPLKDAEVSLSQALINKNGMTR